VATVRDIKDETPHAKTPVLDVPDWPGHVPGQHVDIRLTAEDGYQAERSYSIASAEDGSALELTVERIDDGEVSPYLTDDQRDGDQFELAPPPGWRGFTGRIDSEMLTAVGPEPSERPSVYVCGPTPFVEEAARLLVELGHDAGRFYTERFGPTGG
jgi:ferredoxin-NADP reductase